MKRISITEVAPRDGWQSIREYIPLERKLELIEQMLDAGISRIQAGSFVSPKAIPQMQDARELFETLLQRRPDKNIYALVPNLRGAQTAAECGLKEITTVISVSEAHNKANINRTVSESMEGLAKIRETFPDMVLNLDVATAFGCPFQGKTSLESLMGYLKRATDIGIDGINLCDTIGVAYPAQVSEYVTAVKKEYPNMPLEIHIHDTRGMGMLNTWEAITSGVDRIQTALGGLGGCPFAPGASGNTSTEDVVYMLHRNGFDTGIDFDKLLEAAKHMKSLVVGNYSGHHINISAKYDDAGISDPAKICV